mgnify:CR=1 FL=1
MLNSIKRIFFSLKTPLLTAKLYNTDSVFKPGNLLREARRQLRKPLGSIPAVVVLDPDGDILDYLLAEGEANLSQSWACYHSKLYEFSLGDQRLGIIGRAVGGPFAVLLAEQLVASGCKLIINITSAGKISENLKSPCYVLVNKALRDEGTSFHYQVPSLYASIRPELLSALSLVNWNSELSVQVGAVWTTDAPYRETSYSIDVARELGLLAVDMETASLYAFATATDNLIVSFAYVTNQMAQVEEDFEKGELSGAVGALNLIGQSVRKVNSENFLAR